MANIQNVSVDTLRRLDVFAGLPETSLDQLLQVSSVCQLSARQKFSSTERGLTERYCFVLDGAVAIALQHAPIEPTAPSASVSPPPSNIDYIGYFESGACFSDGFYAVQSTANHARIDCIATAPTTLLQVESNHLGQLMARHAAWRQQLTQRVSACRSQFLTHQEPARRVVQDFFLRQNYSTSSVVRVGRWDSCLDCNKCHDACAARHGAPRMARGGPQLGRLTFPVVCRTCHDKPCIAACGFGSLTTDSASGDIRILDQCAGCGACVQSCPNGAITMIHRPYTVADFPDPLPMNNGRGMTNVGNLLVAGDVSGAALIRTSMNEAVRAVDSIGPRRTPVDPKIVDVAIIGAGPAGLAAAVRCRERNLSCVVLEKDRLASTIQDYPKHKHVMAEPSTVPLMSSLWFQDCTKEELLERWQMAVREQHIPILPGTEVRQVEAANGLFYIRHDQGQQVAEHVVVCIGKRGSPRKLGVAGEAFPRVRYVLSDADEFAGQNVLVVGGGDSALEAALSLADVPGTHVWLSYRQGAFTRAKALNRQRVEEYRTAGRVQVILKSTVKALENGAVRLSTEVGEQRIANDVVIAQLGADPPTGFLQQIGIQVLQPGTPEMWNYAQTRGERHLAVKCDHCAGFSDRACLTACPTGSLIEMRTEDLFLEPEPDPSTHLRRFSDAPFLSGFKASSLQSMTSRTAHMTTVIVLLLVLFGLGIESFLRATLPERSLTALFAQWVHQNWVITYTSGRGLGHWLGYIGTSAMLASVLYSARTRIKRLQHLGSQSTWLSLHVWLGFAGATLVTYHSALKLNRWASIACILMWVVILTGAVGRLIYGRVHSAVGLAEFELNALRRKCNSLARASESSWAIRVLLGDDSLEGRRSPIAVVMLWHELRDHAALLWLRLFGGRHIADSRERRESVRSLARWAANRRRSSYYQSTRAMLKHWNIIHIVLAIAMFVLAGIHIVYGFMYKAV